MSPVKTNMQFTVELPEEWEDRTVYTFMGPDDSGVQHILTLVIDPEPEDEDLTEFARERIDLATGNLQSVEILKEEPKTLPSGREVYECVYKWIPVDGKIIFQKLVYMIIDGAGYTFSANFTKKTIKTIGRQVESIIDTFSPSETAEEADE